MIAMSSGSDAEGKVGWDGQRRHGVLGKRAQLAELAGRVAFVSVVVRRGDAVLTEVAQLLATGGTRTRRLPPSEKMHPGEDVETAAYR